MRRPHEEAPAATNRELSNIYEGSVAPKNDEKCKLPFLSMQTTAQDNFLYKQAYSPSHPDAHIHNFLT